MTTLTEINRRYFNCLAYVYDWLFLLYFQPLYARMIKLVTAKAEKQLRAGINFLDIACGTGEIVAALAKHYPQSHFFGLDIAERALAKARKRTRQFKNIQFIQADARQLPFKDNSFDFVLISEAFHHFDFPKTLFAQVKRVLKPGGLFLMVDPDKKSWFDQPLVKKLISLLEPSYRYYTQAELKEFFSAHQFSLVQSFYFWWNNFVLGQKSTNS